jgi:hypothetical protein
VSQEQISSCFFDLGQGLKSRKKKRRFGSIVFFAPAILILAVIAYAIGSGTGSPDGSLTVTAQSSDRYYPSVSLTVAVSVSAYSGTTPFALTLLQGPYTVTFGNLQWYNTPTPRVLTIYPGRSSYAVGVYNPKVDFVAISSDQFNVTGISAKQSVTPVVWINKMSTPALIYSSITGTVRILPTQNYTYIFKSTGAFDFSLQSTVSTDLVVQVV